MQHKDASITYIYHFLSETLIAFLLLLPVMHYVYEWIPYWRYLALVLVACCLLFMPNKRVTIYSRVSVMIPILVGLCFIWQFPVTWSLLFPLVFMWRYMNIVRAPILNRENSYIKISLVLVTIYVLLIQDVQIMVYTFGLFTILIFGYMLGHMQHLDKQQRQHINPNLFTYTALTLAGSALVGFLAYDIVKWITAKLWLAYGFILILFSDSATYLMEKIGLEFPSIEREQDIANIEGNMDNGPADMSDQTSFMTGPVTTYIYMGLALLLGVVFVWLIYRLLKKRTTAVHPREANKVTSQPLTKDTIQKQSLFKRLFSRYGHKPNHVVRKMMYDLERQATKNGQGRYPFETINSWLDRFDMQADMSIYDRVRYGEEDVTKTDIEAFKQELETIALHLRQQRKQD